MEASRYSEALEQLDVLMRSSTARAVRCLRRRALPRHLRHRANGHASQDSNAGGGADGGGGDGGGGGADGGGGGDGGGDKGGDMAYDAPHMSPHSDAHHMSSPPSAPLRREEEVVALCMTSADAC
jgi:hypothetical protein